jgi:hypothetical protein
MVCSSVVVVMCSLAVTKLSRQHDLRTYLMQLVSLGRQGNACCCPHTKTQSGCPGKCGHSVCCCLSPNKTGWRHCLRAGWRGAT